MPALSHGIEPGAGTAGRESPAWTTAEVAGKPKHQRRWRPRFPIRREHAKHRNCAGKPPLWWSILTQGVKWANKNLHKCWVTYGTPNRDNNEDTTLYDNHLHINCTESLGPKSQAPAERHTPARPAGLASGSWRPAAERGSTPILWGRWEQQSSNVHPATRLRSITGHGPKHGTSVHIIGSLAEQ